MAKRITELTSATVLTETDLLPIVDTSDTTQATSGTTKKSALSLIADYLKARVETLTNKTLTSPVLNSADINTPDIDGGTIDGATISGGSIASDTDVIEVLKKVFPIGSIYTNAGVSTNPATLFGFGTWAAFGAGKVMVGIDSLDADFDTIGETGGAKTHVHRQGGPASDSSGSAGGAISGPWNDITFGRSSSGVHFGNYSQIVSSGIGSGKTVYPFLTESTSSLQPYIVVHMWKRTA